MPVPKYIPFISGSESVAIFNEFYSDAPTVRVTLDKLPKFIAELPKGQHLWIDTAFEGFHHLADARDDKWIAFMKKFEGWGKFNDPAFIEKPDKKIVEKFVGQLLDAAMAYKPRRLSIPQFPISKTDSRAKINRVLAEASGKWRGTKGFSGALILPVILTHRDQISLAVEKNKRIDHVKKCLSKVAFEGVWAVDSSLQDQQGTQNFEKERFPEIIALFEALRQTIGDDKHLIAGPHWGLQIVLWARGVINEPAIGLGNSYQYHILGSKYFPPGNVRLCLTPLRRWAVWSSQLHDWLKRTIPSVAHNPVAHQAFSELNKNWHALADKKQARRQVSRAYKEWIDMIAAQQPQGRALALFQDLSSAYVLGKTLTDLPKDEGSARRPERVAQQLMLNCL